MQSRNDFGVDLNPSTCNQSHTPTVVHSGGGGGVMEPLPWLFAMFQYLGEILPLEESRWWAPQDEVYIMCNSAAGGPGKIENLMGWWMSIWACA